MIKDKLILYEVLFTDCIFDSDYYTVSIHKTKLGAYKALKEIILEHYLEYINRPRKYRSHYKWNSSLGYLIKPIEVKE